MSLGPSCGGVYEGHDGGVPGYGSFLLGNGDRRITLSVTVDPTDPNAVARFSAAFNTLLATAACGGAEVTPTGSISGLATVDSRGHHMRR